MLPPPQMVFFQAITAHKQWVFSSEVKLNTSTTRHRMRCAALQLM